MPSGIMEALARIGGLDSAREAMRRQVYRGPGGSFGDRLREIGDPDRANVEERRWRPDQDPQIFQQLDAMEGAFGPLMEDDRRRIAVQLSSGEITLGQALEQLKSLRADWRQEGVVAGHADP